MSEANFQINTIASLAELDAVYRFAVSVLGAMDGSVHTLAYYREQFTKTPALLVYARQGGKITGCVLASIDGDHVLIGPTAVAEDARGRGVGAAMLRRVEREAKNLQQTTLILGSLQEAEGFYLRCGFRPNLFIQLPQAGQAARLKQINRSYPVIWESRRRGMDAVDAGYPTDRPRFAGRIRAPVSELPHAVRVY